MKLFQQPAIHDIRKLLIDASLPIDDLSELDLTHFFGCGEVSNPKGVVGLEVRGADALLRSLAVDSDAKRKGCGIALLSAAEQHARSIGVKTIYLLTDTAENYFAGKGYESIKRESASETIKMTKQFSDLCPASAVLMKKELVDEGVN